MGLQPPRKCACPEYVSAQWHEHDGWLCPRCMLKRAPGQAERDLADALTGIRIPLPRLKPQPPGSPIHTLETRPIPRASQRPIWALPLPSPLAEPRTPLALACWLARGFLRLMMAILWVEMACFLALDRALTRNATGDNDE